MLLHSIRARMTLGVSCAIGLLLSASSFALIWNAKRTAEYNADSLLAVAARKVEREAGLDAAHIDVSEMIADQRDFARASLAMILVDSRGNVLQRSQQAIPTWPRSGKDGWRVTIVPVGNHTAVIGFYWRRVEQELKGQAVVLGSLSLIVFLAGSIGAWFLVGRTLSPLGRLSRQAEAASGEDLSVRLDTPSQDAEMVQLVSMLNGLLARLADAAAARQRFYAAASHELRTPLQALTGHLGLALRRPRENSEYEVVIREAQEQTRRLNSLVGDLLFLNQLETAYVPASETVDLAEVCEQTLAAYTPLIHERELSVQTDFPSASALAAPPTYVAMLLRNVIENALKYAAAGSCVRVSMSAEGRCLWVRNALSEPVMWEEDKLFEPFYRPDASRTSETGGNGLGLAISKAIAEMNGWTIRLEKDAHEVICTVAFSGSK